MSLTSYLAALPRRNGDVVLDEDDRFSSLAALNVPTSKSDRMKMTDGLGSYNGNRWSTTRS